MSKLYGTTPWKRVLALTLVFVMMLSVLGSSGYTVFAEDNEPDTVSEASETTEMVEEAQEGAETPDVVSEEGNNGPPAGEVPEGTPGATEDESGSENEQPAAPAEGADVDVSEQPSEGDGDDEELKAPASTDVIEEGGDDEAVVTDQKDDERGNDR